MSRREQNTRARAQHGRKPTAGQSRKPGRSVAGHDRDGAPGKPRHRQSGKGRFATATDRPARGDRFERSERPERPERFETGQAAGAKAAKPGRTTSGRPAKAAGRAPARADRTERYERTSRPERPRRDDRADRADRADRGDRRQERYERFERQDRKPRKATRPRHADVVAQEPVKVTPKPAPGGSGTFENFALPAALLRGLEAEGIRTPFPIQSATLPDAIEGRDVMGRAQTGSGKTLAFGLALLSRLYGRKSQPRRPRALVLVPTRELAMQVADALTPLAKPTGLWVRTVVGGMSFERQVQALDRGVDLLIATPGRLSDHVRQGTCSLSDVTMVALDEADQMADMGFLPQVREILDLTPADGQRMLFSATLDGAVGTLVRQYLVDPVEHSVAPATASVDTMDHHVFQVSFPDKQAVAAEIGAREGRTIMFVRTKHHADRVAKQMRNVGVPAAALHGGKTQGQRNRVLAEFKNGGCTALVATDVAARGIHVDDVSLVLHIDPPNDSKDYLHRAGRTARAGATGTVVTLMTPDQRHTMRRITERAGVDAATIQVRPGDDQLARITGAQQPSGEPLREAEPGAPRPGGGRPPRGRSGGGRPRR